MDYDISIHFGFFLLIFFILLVLTIGLTRFSLYFAKMPERYRDKKTIGDAEKGLDALTLSLSSAAAGDYGHAQYEAERALKLLPGHQPIPLLLQAGAQRKQGEFEKADATLKSLLTHPEGAVLAARALIHNALDQQNITAALLYARTVEKDYKGKDKGWLLQILYELEAKAGRWDNAEAALNKALKYKAISKERAESDSIAIATAKAQDLIKASIDKEALKILVRVVRKKPAFVPAVISLCDLYFTAGKKRAIGSLLKKAWRSEPHPEFLKYWEKLGATYEKTTLDKSWLLKLIKQNRDDIESLYALARNEAANGHYDEAKKHLQKAVEKHPQKRFFKLWADVTEKSGGSEVAVRHHLERMNTALLDPVWICSKTGTTYEKWLPLCYPHGSFNTMIWSSPRDINKTIHANDDDQMYDYLISSASSS
jgi:HemY protein